VIIAGAKIIVGGICAGIFMAFFLIPLKTINEIGKKYDKKTCWINVHYVNTKTLTLKFLRVFLFT